MTLGLSSCMLHQRPIKRLSAGINSAEYVNQIVVLLSGATVRHRNLQPSTAISCSPSDKLFEGASVELAKIGTVRRK